MTKLERNNPSKLDVDQQRLAQAHLYLVKALAWRQFQRCGRTMPLEELVGEAQLALTYATSLFDQKKGVPFGAYVTMVIRHRLVHAVTVWRRSGRLDHVRFTDLTGSVYTVSAPNHEPICSRATEAVQEAAVCEQVEQIRRVLPARWFRIVQMYFGEGYTFEEIAQELGVSRERVRQLLAKAVARARSRLSPNISDGLIRHCRNNGRRQSA